MNKFVFAVRGGLSDKFKTSLDELLKDSGVQDNVFILDVNTHSFTVMAGEEITVFIKRVLGANQLSIINQSGPANGTYEYFYGLGKIMDGQLQQRSQQLGSKLF